MKRTKVQNLGVKIIKNTHTKRTIGAKPHRLNFCSLTTKSFTVKHVCVRCQQFIIMRLHIISFMSHCSHCQVPCMNSRRACAARVTVLGLCDCLCVCLLSAAILALQLQNYEGLARARARASS